MRVSGNKNKRKQNKDFLMRAEKVGDFPQKREGWVVVEAGEGEYKMSELNPKEKFLNGLVIFVGKFEQETGVEIKNICFERLNTAFPGGVTEETTITKIELEMR
jgi:hypothetical protein